jgi:hypothetical protein
MGTEQDKTNAAVVGTMLAIGAAAMIGGTAALVALARGEIHSYSEDQQGQGFTNLAGVSALKATQRQRLDAAKLPIDKAKAQVVADLQRNPNLASPPLPEPVASVAPDASASGSVDGASSAPPSESAAPAESGAPTEGAVPTEGAEPEKGAAVEGAASGAPSAPAPKVPAPKAPAPKLAPSPSGSPASSGH